MGLLLRIALSLLLAAPALLRRIDRSVEAPAYA